MLYPTKLACNILIFSDCWSDGRDLVLNILFFPFITNSFHSESHLGFFHYMISYILHEEQNQ